MVEVTKADQALLIDLLELDDEQADRVRAGTAYTAEVEALAAHRENALHASVPAWRNAITNTVILVDRVRRKHAKNLRRSKALSDLDADLDEILDAWMEATRRVAPLGWDQSEKVFKDFTNTIEADAHHVEPAKRMERDG